MLTVFLGIVTAGAWQTKKGGLPTVSGKPPLVRSLAAGVRQQSDLTD